MEPGVAIDLHRDGPGPPCMVHVPEGCRQRVGGRLDPTRMIAASVTVSELVIPAVTLSLVGRAALSVLLSGGNVRISTLCP